MRTGASAGALAGLVAWILSAKVVGVAISLAVHTSLAVVAALILTGSGVGDGEGPAEFGIAVVSETQLSELPTGEVVLDSPSVDEQALADLPAVEALDASVTAELAGIADDVSVIVSGLTGSGGKDGGGDGSLGGAGGGGAKFFGVEAQGTRIAYIVDRSGSMRGEKLELTKIELFESINTLLEHMSFTVVMFSTNSYSLGGRSGWIEASDSGKRWAERNIRTIDAAGGTEVGPALQIVFDTKPKPDAIYLMTDGQLNNAPLIIERLARVNTGRDRIPIHCLAFGNDADVITLQQIAKDSGGTFTKVNAP